MSNEDPRGRSNAKAVLLICCAAQFMVVLDVSVVIVALPQMRHDLGLSVSGQQWVVNAYTLTFAGLLMLGGRAADLFGRKRVFIVGLAFFTACSLLGGLAQSGPWLIGARALQGVGGAILAPSTLSLLTTTFTGADERRRALGKWSATAASGAAIGVLAGGVLTDLFDWRWVLFVNVPIGIALLAVCAITVKESAGVATRRRLDLPGALTVTAAAAVLVYGIVSTDVHPWGSARTVLTLAAGVVLLAVFILIETRVDDPLVPLAIFKRRSLAAANAIAVTIGISLFGGYFFLSLYLQQVAGYSPLKAGLGVLPAGLATLVAALASPRIIQVLGARRQLIVGPVVAGAGLLWLSRISVGDAYFAHLFGPLVLLGVGLGLAFLPMTISATAGVPAHQSGLASGLINTTRQLGGAVGLAALATIAAGAVPHGALSRAALVTAETSGYDRAFLVSAVVLFVGAALALTLPSPAKAHEPAVAASQEPGPVVVEA
jgi:EmrB/QacA subfamily drug resistance transporter